MSTAVEEQAWNLAQLEKMVTKPGFRVWIYESVTVVLGNAQRTLNDVVRRRTNDQVTLLERHAGGSAVLTGPWMLSSSIVLPYGHPVLQDGLLGCDRWLGQLHVEVLQGFDVAAYAVPPHMLPLANSFGGVRTVNWACFGALSPWEVVSSGYRKLVGLAQRRQQSGVLLVSGMLVGRPNWCLLCEVMGYPEDEAVLRRRSICCEDLAGRYIKPEWIASALREKINVSLAANA